MSVILGIESSCDDASVAVIADGRHVLSQVTASQADDFATWGGVVPELAARGHVAAFPGLVIDALAQAEIQLSAVDAVAMAAWPGLIGSLLCGVTCGKMVAARSGVPMIAVDHIQAHLAAVHLAYDDIVYPHVGLVASGGHSHFYLCRAPGVVELIGGTIDDAAGEAFDKAAATLALGYPGGPKIEAAAHDGDPQAFKLPRSFIRDDTLRLSFAGLKTALLYQVRGPQGQDPLTLEAQGVADACASFQAAVVEVLIAKLRLAARQHQVAAVAIGGGVACNGALRHALAELAAQEKWQAYIPQPAHCADNGAMIGALGYFQLQRNDVAAADFAPLPTGARGPRRQQSASS